MKQTLAMLTLALGIIMASWMYMNHDGELTERACIAKDPKPSNCLRSP